ncbi:MAG TPA: C40 family peptidase [Gemmatimonadales bacterium]|nr:C40 family peptidase [Gemmatimonadales bacterium]
MIRFASLFLLSVMLVPGATAQAQAVAHDSALSSVGAAALHDSVASVSRSQLGTRYRLGAAQPGRRFDCSGLVQYVMSVFHVLLPRTAAAQAQLGVAVPRDATQLLPGDILTFGRGRRITHVGIYVGDGRYIHASSRRRTVVEVPLPDPDTRQGRLWKGARRVLNASARADTDSVPRPIVESPAS